MPLDDSIAPIFYCYDLQWLDLQSDSLYKFKLYKGYELDLDTSITIRMVNSKKNFGFQTSPLSLSTVRLARLGWIQLDDFSRQIRSLNVISPLPVFYQSIKFWKVLFKICLPQFRIDILSLKTIKKINIIRPSNRVDDFEIN